MQDTLKTTPLHDVHVALGAKMMPFGGYDMPVQYTSILDEHRAVREAAGLFDVSHMGEVWVRGPEALAFVQRLVTNDASKLFPPGGGPDGAPHGRVMYTVMCREDGTAVDDLLVYRMADDAFFLVINAANIAKDLAHLRALHAAAGLDCAVEDVSEETALLALQGPRAFDAMAEVTDLPVADLPYYHFLRPEPGAFLGCERAILSHTGYTGERGLEIYCEAEKAVAVWDALTTAGVISTPFQPLPVKIHSWLRSAGAGPDPATSRPRRVSRKPLPFDSSETPATIAPTVAIPEAQENSAVTMVMNQGTNRASVSSTGTPMELQRRRARPISMACSRTSGTKLRSRSSDSGTRAMTGAPGAPARRARTRSSTQISYGRSGSEGGAFSDRRSPSIVTQPRPASSKSTV